MPSLRTAEDRRPRALLYRGPEGVLEGVCEYTPPVVRLGNVAVGSLDVLAVRADVRATGIGTSAFKARLLLLSRQARALGVAMLLVTANVHETNVRMISLLERKGFRPDDRLVGGYYRWTIQMIVIPDSDEDRLF